MLFSRRHPRLRTQVSLPKQLRNSIYYVLCEHSIATPWENSIEQAEYQYKKQLGLEDILSFDDAESRARVKSNLEGVIKNGYPSEVLDMIEAFLTVLDNNRNECEGEINDFFKEHAQSWRLLDGQFVKLDSEYLSQEVISKARSLLAVQGFSGPLDEFDRALGSLSSGDFRTAITYANNTLESAIKSVLSIERAKPGELIRSLINSGLVPEHHKGFLNAFETILRTVQLERNEPGRGHGQGLTVSEVESSVAELCLNLTGTLVVFLIKRYQEKTRFETSVIETPATNDIDDLPF